MIESDVERKRYKFNVNSNRLICKHNAAAELNALYGLVPVWACVAALLVPSSYSRLRIWFSLSQYSGNSNSHGG